MSTRILKLTLLAAVLSIVPRIYGQVYPNAKTGGNYMYNYYFPPAASSTPWWPSWSPDGQWIAFAMDGSIWKARPGDSTAYEVIYGKDYLSSPEWSPMENGSPTPLMTTVAASISCSSMLKRENRQL